MKLLPLRRKGRHLKKQHNEKRDHPVVIKTFTKAAMKAVKFFYQIGMIARFNGDRILRRGFFCSKKKRRSTFCFRECRVELFHKSQLFQR